MSSIETDVMTHYGSSDLAGKLFAGLSAAGLDRAALDISELALIDELHVGGRGATMHVAAKLRPNAGDLILDVGSGLGGAARYIAKTFGCMVTGIDITKEFVELAETLAALTGLTPSVNFERTTVLAMPFDSGSFDAAMSLHTAMNIESKALMYEEVARVLKAGAIFINYDIMLNNVSRNIDYPLPWAGSPNTSFVASADETCSYLEAAGFEVMEVEDRKKFAMDFFEKQASVYAASANVAPLGVHLVLGKDAASKLHNLFNAFQQHIVSPVQIVARKK